MEGFISQKTIGDETFFFCDECNWSTDDIETANKIGEQMMQILEKTINHGNGKPN